MKTRDLLRLSFSGVLQNRIRSALTILGIVIGIAAVIALLAIGQGAKVESDKQIQMLGLNLIFIRAGAAVTGAVSMGMGSASTLTVQDAQAILDVCPTIANVAPGINSPQQVQYGEQNTSTTITATVPDYTTVRNFHAEKGRFFNGADMERAAPVCVVGQTVLQKLYLSGENPVGTKLLIRGESYEVIGTMEHKGVTAFTDMDDQIFVPLPTAYNRIFGLNATTGQSVTYIVAQAKSLADVPAAQFQITNLLRLRHKIKPPLTDDFYMRTQMDLMQTSEAMSRMFTLLLGSTAGISLLVGGIGIMNIMLVSVSERTHEIGIRKAVGACPKDILLQFIVEAATLSLIGGLLGIGLGVGGSALISAWLKWTTIVTPFSVIISFLVSIMVGLFFGIYPAKRAASLDPIAALHAE